MAIFKSRKKSSSSSLQTKTATADTDDIVVLPDLGYDGMSAVTVHPTPTETKTVTAGTSDVTVTPASGKYLSEVTVEPTPSQSKSVTATTSSQTVSPDTGKLLSSVTVNPQAHTTTYTPATNTSANDMGANHEYRYVNTSGMIVPSGTKYITENGQSDVTNYATVDVNVSEIPSTTLHPNNSIPDSIENGMAYQAMGNGYAIASYDFVTPSSEGDFVSSGDIVKFGGNGVIFDSIPTPSLQTKNVTATTSGLTVEPDSGYVGLLAVGIAPQPHTDTYFPNEDTAQNDMGVVHNYRYVNTSGMVTPSSITPSNSSPEPLASGSAVTPTANGYAIESYDSVTPSSTPTSVSSGDIVKIGGSGVIVDSIPTPTSLTPSNSTPATITSGATYTATANGKAVSSVTDITPSNSSPATITSGSIYKASANGKAVASVTDITPTTVDGPVSMSANAVYRPTVSSYAINEYTQVQSSDSNPPTLSPGHMYRIPAGAGMGGYLYKTQQTKCKAGTGVASASANTKITLGFKPKYLCVINASAINTRNVVYDETISTTKFAMSTSSSNCTAYDLGTTNSYRIYSIDNDGFTLTKWNNNNIHYFAIG